MGARILYVEDNFENRILVKRVLEADGHSVIEAETGKAGLQMAAEATPDLILVDINLPDIDGYEVTGKLRQMESIGRKVPIIALTANALEGDKQKALSAGCDGYLPKPVDIDLLSTSVKDYLKQ